MSTIEQSIEVNVPVRTAYNQWTQFETFPQFMEGVQEIRQLDDTHVHWRVEVGGHEREWDAEITEQTPDQRVAWKSEDGAPNAGVVTFHKVADGTTRIMLQMDYEPEGVAEKAGDVLGVAQRRVKGDLERFKELIEGAGSESGAWRGEVAQDPTSAGVSVQRGCARTRPCPRTARGRARWARLPGRAGRRGRSRGRRRRRRRARPP